MTINNQIPISFIPNTSRIRVFNRSSYEEVIDIDNNKLQNKVEPKIKYFNYVPSCLLLLVFESP
jgi:hypothetical protein